MLQRFSSCFCSQPIEFQVSKLELVSVSQFLISSLPHPLTPLGSEIASVCDSPMSQLRVITEEFFGSLVLARCLTSLNMLQYSAVRCHLVTEGNLYFIFEQKKYYFGLHFVNVYRYV